MRASRRALSLPRGRSTEAYVKRPRGARGFPHRCGGRGEAEREAAPTPAAARLLLPLLTCSPRPPGRRRRAPGGTARPLPCAPRRSRVTRFPRPAARRPLRPGCVSGAGAGVGARGEPRGTGGGARRGPLLASPGGRPAPGAQGSSRASARPQVSDPRGTERRRGDAAASSPESWPGRGPGRPGGRARGPRRP